jgi:membrane protease YdiL (CAAX protease family)
MVQMQRQERALIGVLAGVLAGATLLMTTVELLWPVLPSVGWRDFLIQAFSLALYLGAVVWVAMRGRPRALPLAIGTCLIVWVACALGNLPSKAGIPMSVGHLSNAPEVLTSPRLLWGLAFFLVVFWLAWLYRRYPEEMHRAGLNPVNWPVQLGAGLLVGLGLCGHLIFSNFYSPEVREAINLSVRPWRFHFWAACYEAGVQTWAEELFFRGFVFARLFRSGRWGFWRAALVTSTMNLLLYLPKREWTADPLVMVGLLFYIFLAGMIYAALYRRFNSIWPSFVANLIFGTFSTLL